MGYVYAFMALACIGSYMIPVRFAKAKGLSFFHFMGWGILFIVLFRVDSLRAVWAHPLWFGAAILSGVLWAVGQSTANLALEEVSLAKAVVYFNFNTLLNILIGLTVFHEAAGIRSFLFVLVGSILLSVGALWVTRVAAHPSREGNLKKGIFLSLLTGFFWGIYFFPVTAVQRWDPQPSLTSLDVLSVLMLGGAIPALSIRIFHRRKEVIIQNLGLGVAAAGLWALGMGGFLMAIQTLGLSRAVPIVNSSSLVYAVWSLFVFKELPFSAWPKVLGSALLVVVGVTLMALSK